MLWLEKTEHSNFSRWSSKSASQAKEWYDLEAVLRKVIGLYSWTEASNKACKEVCRTESNLRKTTTHFGATHQREVGRLTAQYVLENSTTDWKEHARPWVVLAFTTLAGRLISLWKKSESRALAKGKTTGTIEDSRDDTDAQPPEKEGLVVRPKGFASTRVVKKVKRNKEGGRFNIESSEEHDEEDLRHPILPPAEIWRYQIVIQVVDTLDKTMDGLWFTIAINATIAEKYKDIEPGAIVSTHLDWQKVKKILVDANTGWSIAEDGGAYDENSGRMRIFYEDPLATGAEKKKEICGQEGFVESIGNLHIAAHYENTLGRDLLWILQRDSIDLMTIE